MKLRIRMSRLYPRAIARVIVNGHELTPPIGFSWEVRNEPAIVRNHDALLDACNRKMSKAAGLFPATYQAWAELHTSIQLATREF